MWLVGLAAAALLAGCKKNPCDEKPGEIAKELKDAGVVIEGAKGCGFGAPTNDSVMEHLAYSKVHHGEKPMRVGLDYIANAEKNGWERVACGGGLGTTSATPTRMVECAKKGDKRVRFEAYELDGTCVDIDLLRLKTKEEVLQGK